MAQRGVRDNQRRLTLVDVAVTRVAVTDEHILSGIGRDIAKARESSIGRGRTGLRHHSVKVVVAGFPQADYGYTRITMYETVGE